MHFQVPRSGWFSLHLTDNDSWECRPAIPLDSVYMSHSLRLVPVDLSLTHNMDVTRLKQAHLERIHVLNLHAAASSQVCHAKCSICSMHKGQGDVSFIFETVSGSFAW